MKTDVPAQVSERLQALRRYDILDTPPDGAFDRVAALARRWFGTPVALVSLVDEDRIWFKARAGLELTEIPREPGLCESVVLSGESTYEVLDALKDARTAKNSLVTGDFGLRFYAAAPIVVDGGHRLGTVCVIDHEPRGVSDEDREVLRDLAAIVADEMQLRLVTRERGRLLLERAEALRRQSLGQVALGMSHDLSNRVQSTTAMLEEIAAGDGLERSVATSIREVVRRLEATVELCAPIVRLEEQDSQEAPPLDLTARLERILPLLEASAGGRQRERQLEATRTVPLLAYDFDLILETLYRQALSRCPESAAVRVISQDALRQDGDQEGVLVRVSHDGRPISEEFIVHLHDPLDTVVGQTADLELPVIHSVIARSGGVLEVAVSDQRTDWSLWLPSVQPRRAFVLVVEDDELVRGALTRALSRDHEVEAFADAASALEWSLTHPVAALVSDHNLPEMSGVELARALRQRNPSLPIMIVTGYRLEGALDEGFAFLRKPFPMSELRGWLNDVLEAAG